VLKFSGIAIDMCELLHVVDWKCALLIPDVKYESDATERNEELNVALGLLFVTNE
jgi:hypothetical protein